MLVREVITPSRHRAFGATTAILLVAPLLGGLLIGPQLMRSTSASRVDVARADITQLVHVGRRGCAHGPLQLARHGLRDPWGTPYRLVCTVHKTVVISAGEDRTFGTRDDLIGGLR
jgi:hypothetical protein